MPLLQASKSYKPFEYPWAYDFWKRQQQIHWMPEEVPLGEDCRDWAQKLTDHERNLLTQIFRFFTQADVEVQDCYHDKYGSVFKPGPLLRVGVPSAGCVSPPVDVRRCRWVSRRCRQSSCVPRLVRVQGAPAVQHCPRLRRRSGPAH